MRDSDVKALFPWPADVKLKNGKHCGKSQLHWQKQARELYADCLLRAAQVSGGPVGQMVHQRIIAILVREDPEMLQETVERVQTMRHNMGLAMQMFMLTPAERRAQKKRKTKP